MNQLNLGLASYGIALAIHRLGDSIAFSWSLIGFGLVVAVILLLKFEGNEDALDNQLNLLLTVVLSLFGGVIAWF